jgi:SAM-dependent methyltransferase
VITKYEPVPHQGGKDVVWVPTPNGLVRAALKAAHVAPGDRVYDLGCGDGRILRAATRLGAAATGVEFNPDMAALARRRAPRGVRIIQGDLFDADLSDATVVAMYLLPHLNLRLRPKLLALKPGTRIISFIYHMDEWEPDDVIEVDGTPAYLWFVPTPIEGHKELRVGPFDLELDLVQRFQRVGGTVTIAGKTQPLLSPSISGTLFRFTFVSPHGNVVTARVTITQLEHT